MQKTSATLPHSQRRIPFPHTEHDFLRNWIPQLAGKHGNLSAMVSVMSDEISEKADRVGENL